MGRTSTSPRYVIDIIGLESALYWGVGGGGVNAEKCEKMRYF